MNLTKTRSESSSSASCTRANHTRSNLITHAFECVPVRSRCKCFSLPHTRSGLLGTVEYLTPLGRHTPQNTKDNRLTTQRMFGLWESPITPKSLASSLRLGEPCWDTDGQTLGWIEGRSDRGVLVVQKMDGGAPRDLTTDLSVRAFVGYGGGDFTLSHGAAYFVGQADQRIYRQELSGGSARAITPAFGASANPTISPDGRWLAYVHTYEDVDSIAVVDTQGKHWPQRLGEGRDFYMQPAWSADGQRIAWVEWDHPNMPWDGTELRVTDLAFPEGALPVGVSSRVVAGGPDTAIFQPTFAPDGRIYFVSDESGWGHISALDISTGSPTQVTAGDGEFGQPAWAQGQRSYTLTASGAVVGIRGQRGIDTLCITRAGDSQDIDLAPVGYQVLGSPSASPTSEQVAFIAAGGQQPPRVVVLDLTSRDEAPRVLRRSDSETVKRSALSQPYAVSWQSFDGAQAHGLYYPPASDKFSGTGAPPLVVAVHGGPTSHHAAGWAAGTQFLATRGYAVLHVNYRGSTGHGREYMLKLRNSWGVYDVEDCQSGAKAMAERGLADGTKLVIMGGSAGGYTVLKSLVDHPGFYKAGISMFGVGNLFTLASDTHKFEARYLDSMLGPLPEAAATYRERSPLFQAHKIVDPVCLFQGDIDRVVPREQSDSIAASLRSRGIPHEYHVYEGEGHGWRKAETIENFHQSVDRFLKQYVLFG